MDDHLESLKEGIRKWRAQNVESYWLRCSYLGGELNRFGDHELTYVDGQLYHFWHGAWRQINQGSDFWLFSVPGAFAWARDMITKIAPGMDGEGDPVTLLINDQYGYVQGLQLEVGHRDPVNFTFEVNRFETGPHPEFKRPED